MRGTVTQKLKITDNLYADCFFLSLLLIISTINVIDGRPT